MNVLTSPLTEEQVRAMVVAERGNVEANITIYLHDVVGLSEDKFYDLLCEKLVNGRLCDIQFMPVGIDEYDHIILSVTANAEPYFEDLNDIEFYNRIFE